MYKTFMLQDVYFAWLVYLTKIDFSSFNPIRNLYKYLMEDT